MSWTPRHIAMLREMGITLWWPGATGRTPHTASPSSDGAQAASPASSPALAARRPAPARSAPVQPAPAQPAAAPAVSVALRPAGIDAMDWPALRDAVAHCQACTLCASRKQTVFGVGHAQAHWMLIGEAPGEQEDQQGAPFVGKAGQLLDRMLQAIGLTRAEAAPEQQVFIANVLKCRPPGNRNPQPDEVAQCEPYLKRQVELVHPKIILAMGRFAVQSILQTSDPIGKLRGRIHHYAGVPVIVTYHPAYLLRSPADKALAWQDLCLAREVLAKTPA